MKKNIFLNIEKQFRESVEMILSGSSIIAVYIFGSILRDPSKKEADIDIAFLLDEKAYKSDPVKSIAPAYLAAAQAGLALNRKTDVTILNGASLEMAYEIISSGSCILETDSEKRMAHEIAIRGMFFDFKPFLDQIRSNCIKAI